MCQIIAFKGADHKTGTTTLAAETARAFAARHPKSKVLYLQSKTEYKEKTAPVQLLNYSVGLATCDTFFSPKESEKALEILSNAYDLIIIDAACNIADSFNMAALTASDMHFVVLNQKENTIRRAEAEQRIMQGLFTQDKHYILNQYEKGSGRIAISGVKKKLHTGKVLTAPELRSESFSDSINQIVDIITKKSNKQRLKSAV